MFKSQAIYHSHSTLSFGVVIPNKEKNTSICNFKNKFDMNAQIIKIRSLSQKVINIFHPTSFFFQKIAREVLEESCREEIDF